MVGLAAYTLLTSAGVRPDMAAGHSYGELVALCAAGALDLRTLPRLSAERAAAILGAAEAAGEEPGTMAAVTAAPGEVESVLRAAELAERVVTANHNAPRQTVISGPERDIQEAVRLLRAAGHSAKRIPVACAFHSPLVAGAGARFAEALARHPVRVAEFPVWANRTAAPHGAEPDAIRAELAAQIGAPVRFVAQIEAMYEAGARIFVEAGPGTVLTRLVGKSSTAVRTSPWLAKDGVPAPSDRGGFSTPWPGWPSPVFRCVRPGCSTAGTRWRRAPPRHRNGPAGRSTGTWSAPRTVSSFPVRWHRPDVSWRRP